MGSERIVARVPGAKWCGVWFDNGTLMFWDSLDTGESPESVARRRGGHVVNESHRAAIPEIAEAERSLRPTPESR